jgi:LPS export ABC transporter protein LptC
MEKLTWKSAFWGVPLLLAIFIGLMLWFTRDTSERSTSGSGLPISVSLDKIELVHGQNGRKQWELVANSSDYYKQQGTIEFVEPQFLYLFPDTEKHVQVKAPLGEYRQKDGKIRLWPRVDALYGQFDFQARGMEFMIEENILRFVGDVRLEHSKIRVESQKASVNVNDNTLKFQENVEVMIYGPYFKQAY